MSNTAHEINIMTRAKVCKIPNTIKWIYHKSKSYLKNNNNLKLINSIILSKLVLRHTPK